MAYLFHLAKVGAAVLPLIFLATSRPVLASPIAHLTLHSQPGDFIGLGGSFDLTYTGDEISAGVFRTLANGLPATLAFELDLFVWPPSNTSAMLYFGTDQLGTEMQTGLYTNVQRAAFAAVGHPGLDVSFDHRGCNTVAGSFEVTEATFSTNNTIASFAANFEQHCEGSNPALFGTFTYDANPVPEPSSFVPAFIACGFAIRRVRNRSV